MRDKIIEKTRKDSDSKRVFGFVAQATKPVGIEKSLIVKEKASIEKPPIVKGKSERPVGTEKASIEKPVG